MLLQLLSGGGEEINMVNPQNFFDLEQVLVNEIIGSIALFIIIAVIVIFVLATRYAVSVQATVMLLALFLCIIVAKYANTLIWVFVVAITGLVFYLAISKKIK